MAPQFPTQWMLLASPSKTPLTIINSKAMLCGTPLSGVRHSSAPARAELTFDANVRVSTRSLRFDVLLISHRHCFSSAVQRHPGSRPSLPKADTTLSKSFETLLSKLLYGSDWLNAIDPVENTAPSFGAVK